MLDDRGSGIWFPEVDGNFSLHYLIQNGSGAHPASYPMYTRGSFPGDKAAWAWSWPLTSIQYRGRRMRGAITPLRGAQLKNTGTTLPFTFTFTSYRNCKYLHSYDLCLDPYSKHHKPSSKCLILVAMKRKINVFSMRPPCCVLNSIEHYKS
jgi:hypothetical protein